MAHGKSGTMRAISPKERTALPMRGSLRKLLRRQNRESKAHQSRARKAVRTAHVPTLIEHATKSPPALRKAKQRRRNELARASRRANR